jgi:hypothetical protein
MLETKIGSYSFSNTTVVPGAWSLDGADVGTVLNKRCPNRSTGDNELSLVRSLSREQQTMTPIQLEQVVDNGPKRRTSANQRSPSDAQPESSRWTDLPSTTLGARSRVRLGGDIFVASRATSR